LDDSNPRRQTRGHRGIKALRTLFQIAVVAVAVWAGARLTLGLALSGVEKYCPFGGLETAWSFLTNRRFSCAAGATNLSLFLALLALTFFARKAFCSWICPFGAVGEWLSALSSAVRRRLGRGGSEGRWIEPPKALDSAMRWLRLPVLALVLYFTYRTGELVFRGYDPYYILFSMHGHDVKAWSYGILAGVLAAGLAIPMAWCRYLCPLGAALWPLSALGRLRLERDEDACTACGSCDRACPHGLPVSTAPAVRSGECTLCLECAGACPSPGALQLVLRGIGP
jgi:polyferredoxin